MASHAPLLLIKNHHSQFPSRSSRNICFIWKVYTIFSGLHVNPPTVYNIFRVSDTKFINHLRDSIVNVWMMQIKVYQVFIHNRRIHAALFSSSETQGQSVKAGEKARRKFSSTGGREIPSPGLGNVQNIGSEWALCYRNFFHLRSLQSSQVKRSLYA